MGEVWTSEPVDLKTKLSVVLPIATYTIETWLSTVDISKRLHVFQQRRLRWIQKISYIGHIRTKRSSIWQISGGEKIEARGTPAHARHQLVLIWKKRMGGKPWINWIGVPSRKRLSIVCQQIHEELRSTDFYLVTFIFEIGDVREIILGRFLR